MDSKTVTTAQTGTSSVRRRARQARQGGVEAALQVLRRGVFGVLFVMSKKVRLLAQTRLQRKPTWPPHAPSPGFKGKHSSHHSCGH